MKKTTLLLIILTIGITKIYSQNVTLLKDIYSGVNSGVYYDSDDDKSEFNIINNKLLFFARNPTTGFELWESDGTEAGTKLIKDINVGTNSGQSSNSYKLSIVLNNKLYFRASDGINGYELWESDGTTSGTKMVKNINPGSSDSYPYNFVKLNNKIFFTADNGSNGRELWESDGTEAGTKLVKDINVGSNGSNIQHLASHNNRLYIMADDGVKGTELWISDGSASGTKLLKDINVGTSSSTPHSFTVYKGKIYFIADDGIHGSELWVTDGTTSETKLLKDIKAGSSHNQIGYLTVFDNKLFFRAEDSSHGFEMWVTDGTTNGTVLFKDINPGTASSYAYKYTVLNNTLFFIASGSGSNNIELWKTDGTSSNTSLVKDINSGNNSSSPDELFSYNNKLYFNAYTNTYGRELWESDGTETGTKLIKDIREGVNGSTPASFKIFKGKLFFTAYNDTYGREFYSFSTGPYVITTNPTNILKNTVSLFGTVSSDNGNNVTETGFVYSSTNPLPLIGQNGTVKESVGVGTGDFSKNLSLLNKNTKYYYRGYAINSEGTSYGEVISFITKDNVPWVTTAEATVITITSTKLGGEVTFQGDNSVVERGVVYSSTDKTPQVNEIGVIKNANGTGTGTFSETIPNLKANTIYYYRSYATNNEGTGYGETKSFTTLIDVPTITTANPKAENGTSATLGGEITIQGLSSVTERGIVYSTTDTNPRIGDSDVIKDTNGTGTGTFSESITSLDANKVYFYRAYATNNQGTGYGAVKKFNMNHSLNFDGTDDRITIEDNAAFDFSSGFTAEAWINPDVLGTQTYLSQYANGQEAFAFILLASGKIEFTITKNGSTDLYFESLTPITAGSWSHVALTFDGTTVRAYINGVASGTNAVSGTLFNSTAPIEIGARNNAHFFNGNIDEVRIWTRVLSAAEVLSQKDIQIDANSNGLVAYYKMNQGRLNGNNTSITSLTDNGPNNLSGTIEGFTKTGTASNFVAGVTGAFGSNSLKENAFDTTGNWSTPGNWSLGVVPTQVDKAIISNGKTVTIDVDNLKIDDFELETGAILAIPKDKEITIQNSFNSSGSLELSSDDSDSGVLFIEGTSSGTITYKRGGLLANKWSVITPPVAGQKIKAFADAVGNDIRKNTGVTPNRYAIAYYDDSQSIGNKWVYYFADMDANIEFEVGKSYAISRATDGEVTFTGTLTTESSTKTLTTNQWAAIGNPFTTYFPANKNSNSSFLNDNLSVLDDTYQSIYMWDNSQNKYIAVTELDAVARSLTPGQGFFIKLKNGQTDIAFNAEKRSTKPTSGNNIFSKTKNTTPSIEVKINDGNNTVNTFIKYFDNATPGFDKGYDIGNFNSESLDIYSRLTDKSNETNFTIQSLPNQNYENMIIPIGVNSSNNSEITFSTSTKNIPNNYKIFLEDKKFNSFYRLDLIDATYKTSITKNTKLNGRFYIHLTPQTLNIDNVNTTNLNVYLSSKRTLTIQGLHTEEAIVKVISILGKELVTKKTTTNQLELPRSLKSGIYIIKIESIKGNLTKKVILE